MPGLPLALSLLVPPTLLGLGALHALGIRWRDDRLAFLGWAWMLGALGTGGVLFAWLLTGLALGRPELLGFVLGLAAALFLTGRAVHAARGASPEPDGAHAPRAPSPLAAAPAWERGLFGLALSAVLALGLGWILAATQRPVMEGDEAGVWNLRAKVIWNAGDLREDFRAAMDAEPRFPVHKDYPLLNPLLQVWAFAMAGETTHTSVRLPVQLLFPALVLALAAALARRVRPAVAALLLLAWFALPQTYEQFHETKADHLVALGLLVALDAWSRGTSGPNGPHGTHGTTRCETRWLALAALGATTMVVSKHEGLPVLLALVAGLLLGARSELGATLRGGAGRVWTALPGLALLGVWGFDRAFGFHNTVARGRPDGGPSFAETLRAEWLERLDVVLPFYRDHVLRSARETNLLFLLFFALLALRALDRLRRSVPPRAVPALALVGLGAALLALGPAGVPLALAAPAWILLAALVGLGLAALEPAHRVAAVAVTVGLLLFVVIYLGTTLSLGVAWHLGTSGVRTAHQLLPAAVLWIAAEASRRFPAAAPRGA